MALTKHLVLALHGARHLLGPRVLCDSDGKSVTQKMVQVIMRRMPLLCLPEPFDPAVHFEPNIDGLRALATNKASLSATGVAIEARFRERRPPRRQD